MVRLLGPTVVLLAALAAVSFQGTGARADDDKKKPDETKQKEDGTLRVEGELTKDDPKDKAIKQSPAKTYDYEIKKGAIVVIDLKSAAFDSYLRLENPSGKQVAANDDAEPNTLDSRIVYKAPAAGTYKIVATCLPEGKVGKFTLTARLGEVKDLEKADPHFKILNKEAPEIVGVHTLNGKAKKLSDLKGKVVLLDFWAVWCGPCIATFPHLREMKKEHGEEGLEILGVTTYYEQYGFDKTAGKLKRATEKLSQDDEHAMLKDFAAHHKLGHQLMTVSKEDWGKASSAYGVRGIPQVVVIDRKGIVRMVKVGSGPENAKAIEEEIRTLLKEK